MIPTLLTATFLFIIGFIGALSVYMDGVREPISSSLLYGNNIFFGEIIPTFAVIGFHFYPIWEVSSIDEWIYNKSAYELIILHFLLSIAFYMGHKWEFSFRSIMHHWIVVAYYEYRLVFGISSSRPNHIISYLIHVKYYQ
jgi:photosystem II P680 reaction center D1 protein